MTAILSADALVLGARSSEEAVTFATRGRQILIVGAPSDLFSALGDSEWIEAGELRIDGKLPQESLSTGSAAVASWQIPLPLAATCRDYLEWNRALFGGGPTITSIESRLGLTHCSQKKLRDLPVHERRSVCIGAALATGASTLFFEDPCEGLGDQHAQAYAQQLVAALVGIRWVSLVPTLSSSNPFAAVADEILRFFGTKVVMQGSAQDIWRSQRSFLVRIAGDANAFADVARSNAAKVVAPTADLVAVELLESDTTLRLFQWAAHCGVRISEVLPYDREVT